MSRNDAQLLTAKCLYHSNYSENGQYCKNGNHQLNDYLKDSPKGGFDGNYVFVPDGKSFVHNSGVDNPFDTAFTVKAWRTGLERTKIDPREIHWIKHALMLDDE